MSCEQVQDAGRKEKRSKIKIVAQRGNIVYYPFSSLETFSLSLEYHK
jgi:hypothetical protein